jgi:hypothetical protein
MQKDGRTSHFPETSSLDWLPAKCWSIQNLFDTVPKYIAKRLCDHFESGIAVWPKSEQKEMRRHAVRSKRLDRVMCEKLGEAWTRSVMEPD